MNNWIDGKTLKTKPAGRYECKTGKSIIHRVGECYWDGVGTVTTADSQWPIDKVKGWQFRQIVKRNEV